MPISVKLGFSKDFLWPTSGTPWSKYNRTRAKTVFAGPKLMFSPAHFFMRAFCILVWKVLPSGDVCEGSDFLAARASACSVATFANGRLE